MSFVDLGIYPSLITSVPQVGDYLSPPGLMNTAGAQPSTTARLYVFPIFVPAPMTFDRVATDLVTQQASSAQWNAVYAWAGGNPNASNALVSDLGALDLTSGTGTRITANINVTLAQGPYFASVWWKNSATAPSIVPLATMLQITAMGSYNSNQRVVCFRVDNAYPASAPLTLPTSLAPVVGENCPTYFLRRSA